MRLADPATRAAVTGRASRRPGAAGRAGPPLRSGAAGALGPAVYRRRRLLVGGSAAVTCVVLTLATRAAFADPGPAVGLLFAPWVSLPLASGCLVGLVRSSSGGWRPASPSPAAGPVTVEAPLPRAA